MKRSNLFAIVTTLLFAIGSVVAQSTEFTYQGRLSDSTVPSPTNGNYGMQFALYDSASAGNQIGGTITNASVQVVNGVFTVTLDYGAAVFSGQNRFLELRIFDPIAADYVTLNPRQPIASTPYAIRSLGAATADSAINSTQLGGVAANQFVQTADFRLSDARPPTPGSPSYIQNGTAPQTANFSISGNGTTGGTLSGSTVNATNQYNLNGGRVFSIPGTNNTFAGMNTGSANTGNNNSFFGTSAGAANLNGSANAFVGSLAGTNNTSGSLNSFFGAGAGQANVTTSSNSFFGSLSGQNNTASNNSFFGAQSGQANTAGSDNSFFGRQAGSKNKTGTKNSFLGSLAGFANTVGTENVFVGSTAGTANTTGLQNTFVGSRAGDTNVTWSNNTAIGFQSSVSGSQNTVIGSGAGGGGSNNTSVGYFSGAGGSNNTTIGYSANAAGNNNTIIGYNAGTFGSRTHSTALGADAVVTENNTIVLGTAADKVSVPNILNVAFNINSPNFNGTNMTVQKFFATAELKTSLGVGGSTQVCRNADYVLSACSSSLRYKTNINPFTFGFDLVKQLQPISFDWKKGGMADVGFGAEDVAKVNELLVIRNEQGEVEGVKYDRLSVLFVNALKEQQAEIEALKKAVADQQRIIEGLRISRLARRKANNSRQERAR